MGNRRDHFSTEVVLNMEAKMVVYRPPTPGVLNQDMLKAMAFKGDRPPEPVETKFYFDFDDKLGWWGVGPDGTGSAVYAHAALSDWMRTNIRGVCGAFKQPMPLRSDDDKFRESIIVWFESETDAVMFKLKWL